MKDCPHQPNGTKSDSKKVAKMKSPKDSKKVESGEKSSHDLDEPNEKAAGSTSSPTSATLRVGDIADRSPGRDTSATAEHAHGGGPRHGNEDQIHHGCHCRSSEGGTRRRRRTL